MRFFFFCQLRFLAAALSTRLIGKRLSTPKPMDVQWWPTSRARGELEAEIDEATPSEVKQSLNAAKQGLDEVKKSVDKATKTVTPYVDEYVPIVRKGVEEYTL